MDIEFKTVEAMTKRNEATTQLSMISDTRHHNVVKRRVVFKERAEIKGRVKVWRKRKRHTQQSSSSWEQNRIEKRLLDPDRVFGVGLELVVVVAWCFTSGVDCHLPSEKVSGVITSWTVRYKVNVGGGGGIKSQRGEELAYVRSVLTTTSPDSPTRVDKKWRLTPNLRVVRLIYTRDAHQFQNYQKSY